MQPFKTVSAVAIPLDMANVDTDQVIPARFLSRPLDERYGSYLFHDLRFDADGKEIPDFILNRQEYRQGALLVADRNFACGSSREHAVTALAAAGFRAVIAPSFGDIFYSNALKNGFLPVRLPGDACRRLRAMLHDGPGGEVTVDLESQTVTAPDQTTWSFEVDPFQKRKVLEGIDDIDYTLQDLAEIEAFEAVYDARMTWVTTRRAADDGPAGSSTLSDF